LSGKSKVLEQKKITTTAGIVRPRLPPPQIWRRREKEVKRPTDPTLIEEVERINVVVVRNTIYRQQQ